jgi:hypothetical protein
MQHTFPDLVAAIEVKLVPALYQRSHLGRLWIANDRGHEQKASADVARSRSRALDINSGLGVSDVPIGASTVGAGWAFSPPLGNGLQAGCRFAGGSAGEVLIG